MHTCISCLPSVYLEMKIRPGAKVWSQRRRWTKQMTPSLWPAFRVSSPNTPYYFPTETKQNVTLKELRLMSLLSSSAFSQRGHNCTVLHSMTSPTPYSRAFSPYSHEIPLPPLLSTAISPGPLCSRKLPLGVQTYLMGWFPISPS